MIKLASEARVACSAYNGRIGTFRQYAVSLDDTTRPPVGSNATPTRLCPATTNSDDPSSRSRYKPLHPASASTTYREPWESNANPCGRPKPANSRSTLVSDGL